MEAKHSKTPAQKAQEEKNKEYRKKSEDIVDPMSGAIHNAQKPMTSLTSATQEDSIAKGKRAGYVGADLSEVKTLDDEPKEHKEVLPQVDAYGKAVAPSGPAQGAHAGKGAVSDPAFDRNASPDLMRNAGSAEVPTSNAKGAAPNKR